MSHENINQINNELAIEFYDLLEKLYKITTDYRFALNIGDEYNFKVYSQNLQSEMQNFYWFYEKNRLTSDLSNKALLLVNQFNKFVPYLNNFSDSPDRKSKTAQEFAKQAEIEFGVLVEMILSYISEIKPTVLRVQEKLEEEKLTQQRQNSSDNNSEININPHIEVNPQINVTPQINITVDISAAIELAKAQAQNSNFDDELLKQVIDRLEELNKIAKEAMPKETRWNKAKNILKWVAEQSIQVASIVIPTIIGII
ncbi:MAG: hypothetical protein HDT28_02745 [Clostridiales bacterium]|nr:hypothetical protein [Clostridiales bacterium]